MKCVVTLLCSILPFSSAFSADDFYHQNVGGFDVDIRDDGIILKEINGQTWVGFYNTIGDFHLININVVENDKLWEMVSYKRGKYQESSNGLIYGSVVSLVQYNCKNKTSRHLQTYAYNEYWGRGRVIQSFDIPGRWAYSVPGTVGETKLRYSCIILKNNKKTK